MSSLIWFWLISCKTSPFSGDIAGAAASQVAKTLPTILMFWTLFHEAWVTWALGRKHSMKITYLTSKLQACVICISENVYILWIFKHSVVEKVSICVHFENVYPVAHHGPHAQICTPQSECPQFHPQYLRTFAYSTFQLFQLKNCTFYLFHLINFPMNLLPVMNFDSFN